MKTDKELIRLETGMMDQILLVCGTGLVIVNPVAPKLREDPKGLEPSPPQLDGGKAAKGVTIIPSKEAP